jgi:hypothetical protein
MKRAHTNPSKRRRKATQYYAQVAVELKSFEKVRRDQAVCEACHECPQDHYFIAKVAEDRWDVLREEGWGSKRIIHTERFNLPSHKHS